MMLFQTQPDQTPKRKKAKRRRPSSRNTLLFVLSFAVALLILAGAAIWYLPKWLPDVDVPFIGDTQSTTTTTAPTAPQSPYTDKDRFSVAVYITDDENVLQSAALALFTPDKNRVQVVGLPAELGLPDADTDTLARRYQTGSADSAQLGLLSAVGKPIDYSVVLSYSDTEAYFTALNEYLTITLPKDVEWQSDTSFDALHLKAGVQSLSPKQVANLLRCDTWQGGKRERAEMHAAIVGAYIDQFVSGSRSIATDRATLQSVADTDLTGERFTIISAALMYLSDRNNGELCRVITTEGQFEGAGTQMRFTPADTMLEDIEQSLKP